MQLDPLIDRYSFLLNIHETSKVSDLVSPSNKFRNIFKILNKYSPRLDVERKIVAVCMNIDTDIKIAKYDDDFKERFLSVTETIFSSFKIQKLETILKQECLMSKKLQARINWLLEKVFLAREKMHKTKLTSKGVIGSRSPKILPPRVESRMAKALTMARVKNLCDNETVHDSHSIYLEIEGSQENDKMDLIKLLPYPHLIYYFDKVAESLSLDKFIEIIFTLEFSQFRQIILSFDTQEIPRLFKVFKEGTQREHELIRIYFSSRIHEESEYTKNVIREKIENLAERFRYYAFNCTHFNEIKTLKDEVVLYKFFLKKLKSLMGQFITPLDLEAIDSLMKRYERFDQRLTKGELAEQVDGNVYHILDMRAFKSSSDMVGKSPSDDQDKAGPCPRLHSPLSDTYNNEAWEVIMEDWNITSLQSYLDMGLLEKATGKLDLTDDYQTIRNNIRSIGLLTVQDLKDNDIYCVDLLREFVRNQHLPIKENNSISAAAAAAAAP